MYLTRILWIFSSLVSLKLAATTALHFIDGGTIDNPQSNCICVPTQQCTDSVIQTDGQPQVQYKGPSSPCTLPDICCPPEKVNKTTVEECGIRKSYINPRMQTELLSRISISPYTANTSFGEFPWMALILTKKTALNGKLTKKEIVCGASILSPSAILTAAHCVDKYRPDELIIRVGEYDTSKDVSEEKMHQDRSVLQISLHPEFNYKKGLNDIALIKVTRKFVLDSHIAPICLPLTNTPFADPASYDPTECIVTGWGQRAYNDSNYETTLKKVELALVEQGKCQNRLRQTKLGAHFTLHPSLICAGGRIDEDTCKGDGGGPLVCKSRTNENQYIQVGIVSWGIECGLPIPALYSSLFANGEWLTKEFNRMQMSG